MFLDYVLYSKFPIKVLGADKKKKRLGFSFLVLYLWFLDFDEDFTMPPKENKVNDGRENQN